MNPTRISREHFSPDPSFDIKKFVSDRIAWMPNFWVELDGNEGVPTPKPGRDCRFYTPSRNGHKNWHEILLERFGLKETKFYDPQVVGLPLEIQSHGTVEHPESVIQNMQFNLWGKDESEAHHRQLIDTLRGYESKEPFRVGETDFARRVRAWHKDYGFLTPLDKPNKTKYEVVREYLFLTPCQDMFLSVAQEPNTDRAIWGLRGGMHIRWPFDRWKCGGEWCDLDEDLEFFQVIAGKKPKSLVEGIVDTTNYLMLHLEHLITRPQ